MTGALAYASLSPSVANTATLSSNSTVFSGTNLVAYGNGAQLSKRHAQFRHRGRDRQRRAGGQQHDALGPLDRPKRASHRCARLMFH